MPAGTGIAPPRCHPPPDGGTLRHVNNSIPGPLSEGSVHGNGSRQPVNWLSAIAEPFVTVLAHGNGVNIVIRYDLRSTVWPPEVAEVKKKLSPRITFSFLDVQQKYRCLSSCSPCREKSNYIYGDLEGSTSIFDLRSRSKGDLTRSCCILFDAS